MKRVPEPELMTDPDQVNAYAEADFEIPHSRFIELIEVYSSGAGLNGKVLELGCGPGDITRRFARAFPECRIDAVDGSGPMLEFAENHVPDDIGDRIRFLHARIPADELPETGYDVVISNSLLHHLPDPGILWRAVTRYGASGAKVFIMDLLRPASKGRARALVAEFAGNEPYILQQDFYNSLLAAFTLNEIKLQLEKASLPFSVRRIGDRHVFIAGVL
ncbi:MAG: class I SAM-dependent methyltransferase [Gammaproteobacteria bacterium]